MSLKGNPSNLRKLAAAMRQMPKVLAQKVAARVAPDLTQRTQAAFGGGKNVYGDARPTGVDGGALSLTKTGATRSKLFLVNVGTIVRAHLGTRYAKYLIGKYKILPAGNAPMPVEWQESIGKIARAEIERGLVAL